MQEVLAEVKEKRQQARPSKSFLAQLEVWRELDYDVWEDKDKKVPKVAYAKLLDEKKLTGSCRRLPMKILSTVESFFRTMKTERKKLYPDIRRIFFFAKQTRLSAMEDIILYLQSIF